MSDTKAQFEHVIGICRNLFVKKLHDYGASWRIMRPESITDQIFIKAKRIRNLEIKKVSQVGEGIYPEFVGIVNYGIIGLIQLDLGFASSVDISNEKAQELYDKFMTRTKELMYAKNADYDEAWRDMRINSYTDLILTKIQRTKQIEDNHGEVPTDAAMIDATIAREGWADGTGLVKVDGMPHCPTCGYINRKTKHCVNCNAKLKF